MVTEEFVYDGRECKTVWRGAHWCGYVKTPLRFGYNDLYFGGKHSAHLIDVHGGITYGVDKDGWIGFDTNHAGDGNVSPEGDRPEPVFGIRGREDKTWDSDEVRRECERLADQLTLIESFVETVTSGDEL